MPSEAYFNEMSERAARLATAVRDPALAARLRQLAIEYSEMAFAASETVEQAVQASAQTMCGDKGI